jgi:hypothetical protein
MEPFEKLGAFYLGRSCDPAGKSITDDTLLYDSRDLLTHAFCVGMTGSGKTGLCVSLLEEAAIDGIPAIVIDPKGDLANLLLTFPDLSPGDFRPWINEAAANRQGMTPDAYAEAQADLWRDGLARWGQSGERIRRLRDAADFRIYTPGSEAGTPVSILASFHAPPAEMLGDTDALNQRISSTVTSLLTLIGIDADGLTSREHILLSLIFEHAWKNETGLELADLIQGVQTPPVSRIGVMELETFFPAKDRFELAMALNNLLASPGFETWLSGDPLDIDQLLYTATGRPRVAIFSIAHLPDTERMFFVSLLLNQILGWVRTRPGTTSLRALVYMDEIFGYIPPVAEPPSKRPLLTLLKQARAYGVGIVLATQNPVDIDYRALSNIGTWFVGRLQTDRDRERVLDGLAGSSAAAAAGFDKKSLNGIIAGLGKRVFLMHNIHENQPAVFYTRWAMSYLSGPLTRTQIRQLTEPIEETTADTAAPAESPRRTPDIPHGAADRASRPMLPPGIPEGFLPSRRPTHGDVYYSPGLLGIAHVRFVHGRSGPEHTQAVALWAPLNPGTDTVDWDAADILDVNIDDIEKEPLPNASFGSLPSKASRQRSFAGWRRTLVTTLYRNQRYELFKSARFKAVSMPGESERDFRIRLSDAARENRDFAVEKLRRRFTARARTIEDRIRRAELAVDREKEQAKHQKLQTAISFGATMLSAFLGRKRTGRATLGRATTTARGVGRSAKETRDIELAKARLATLKEQLETLQADFDTEVDRLDERFDPETEILETITLTPRKKDIEVSLLTIAWAPEL